FSFEVDGLGKNSLVEHSIDTGEAKPIKQRYYALSPARQKLLCEEIDRMIAQDVIEEAPSSAWSSPVTLLVKPNKVRFCLDARKLNSVTIKDAYIRRTDENNIERAISNMSKKLKKAQRNYTVTEKECLAVVLANLKVRILARWALKLQRYTFKIENRRGSQNIVPDALSRFFEEADVVNAIELVLSPTIDLTSSVFRSEEYTALKDKFIEAGLRDFQVIDNFLYHRN
ncbi:hypothetical protein KR026_004821, partial [Drosophila bipectinata]